MFVNVFPVLAALRHSLTMCAGVPAAGGTMRRGTEEIMRPKFHGTTAMAVQRQLRWGVERELADWCCSHNRHFAETSGYWRQGAHRFLAELERAGPTTYCDSVTGKPLFVAPLGRSMEDFLSESAAHGWPSFRDEEVVWENVRVLSDGETVSVVSGLCPTPPCPACSNLST
jgi:hypothetical protein